MRTLTFITDAGHGWLKVPLDEYPDAVLCGTGYGYTDGTYIYLEEDVEATAFLRVNPDVVFYVKYDGDWSPVRQLRHNVRMEGAPV